MVLKYDLKTAEEYLRKLAAQRNEKPRLPVALMQQARLEARPVFARGLTTGNETIAMAGFAGSLVAPANMYRRLLIFTLADTDFYINPLAPYSTPEAMKITVDNRVLVVDDATWGFFATCEWYATGAGFGSQVRVFQEVYLT